MGQVLIAYSTTDGHTRRIAERMRGVIEAQGHRVDVKPLADCAGADLESSSAVVIGASIRYGKHKPEVAAFVGRHRAALDARPNALFSVNVVARKPAKNRAASNPYFQKLLRELNWQPRLADVFAGRIDYPALGPVDRTMIRFIMWLTKGPTDPKGTFEFTDWARVDAFAQNLARAAGNVKP
jgi:menaquinone-dependent protoporphyrinogen oxidase